MADNPQAFPCLDNDGYTLSMRDPGMTLLDYFAGQAITGYLSEYQVSIHPDNAANMAKLAYQLAAAMLNERQSHEG